MIFILLKLILFSAILIFFGWQFVRKILKQNELYVVFGASLALGIFSYTFLINFLAYFLDIQNVFWLGLFLLFFLSVGLYFLKAEKLILGISQKSFKYLITATVVFFIFFGSIFFVNEPFDEVWHGPLISTIASGNFPVMKIGLPDSYVQYHYAFDLFAAGISYISGASVITSSTWAMLWLVISALWLSFMLLYKFTKNIKAAFISTFLLFFGAGFRYLTVLQDISWGESKYLWDYLHQALALLMSAPVMSARYFHTYSVDAFGVNMYHRPTLYSVPLILFIIWLAYLELKRPKEIIYKIVLGLSLGFLALSAETSFVLLAVSWGVWRLVLFFIKKVVFKFTAISIATVALIASGVAIFQGGIITDALLHKHLEENFMVEYSQFELRTIPGLISYDKFFPFNKIYSWAFMFIEWGFILFLFPFVIKHILKKKNVYLYFLLTIVIISLMITFFVHYPEKPGEMTRVNFIAFLFMSIGLGVYLADLWGNKKFRKWIVAILVIVSISPLCYNLRIFPAKFEQRKMNLENVDITKEQKVAEWSKKNLPKNSGILTASPRTVTQLWGMLTFFGTDSHNNRFATDSLLILTEKNDLEYIKSRKVGYIYKNPMFVEKGAMPLIEKNTDKLELIYENGDDYMIYLIK